jgi:hypothetical protein
MNKGKTKSTFFIIITILLMGLTIYDIVVDKNVGFFPIAQLAVLIILFFSMFTWGEKNKSDGILPNEELGKQVTNQSSNIAYKILIVVIFCLILVDKFLNNSINLLLLIAFFFSLITLPLIEFVNSKKYQ